MSRWVIDQNYFRDDDLRDLMINATAGDEFVITDYAFVEMLKSPKWELTARESLAIVSAYPQLIFVTKSPSQLLKTELSGRVAVANWSDVVDIALTKETRVYFYEISAMGQTGPIHLYISSTMSAAHADLSKHHQNHSENLKLLTNGVKALQKALQKPLLDDLRRGRMSDETRIKLAVELGSGAALTLLQEHGSTLEQANEFLANDSFLLRSQISFNLLLIAWLEQSGIDTLRADKATNDIMDIDYALFGSYCDGVLSRENRVLRHHQLLTCAVTLMKQNNF